MVREDWYRRLAAANRLVVDARTQVMRLTQQISRLERQGRSTKKPFSQLRGSEQTLVALSDYRAMVLNQVRSYPLPSPRSTEPFTLIIWLWMGQRFEETRIENLTREECFEQYLAIGGDQALVWMECTAPATSPPPVLRQCGYCGSLPGRKRV
jgi:hypothetical protein